jgi:hypothetical protein
MAIKLRETRHIRGIKINLNSITGNLKYCQLADNTTVFLKTKHDITIAMNIIEELCNLSGLKLNKNKTEGIWLGRLKHNKDKYANITWTNEPIKSLGV